MTYTSDELAEIFKCLVAKESINFEWCRIGTNAYTAKFTVPCYDKKEDRMICVTVKYPAIVPVVDEVGNVQFLTMDRESTHECEKVNKL